MASKRPSRPKASVRRDRKLVIAVDGPAGSGKSTIARMVAHRLSYRHVDTGAIYRAFTWKALQDNVPADDPHALARLARRFKLRFVPDHGGTLVFVDKDDVTHRIRTERVSQMTSQLSAVRDVRKALLGRQRRLARPGVVMEGRDIGTAVLPKADLKVYLDASPEERARRRFEQMKARGQRVSLKSIAAAIRARDHRDKTRGVSPLRPADDAVVVDSTHLAPHDVVDLILSKAAERRREF